jgi:hypothetical protein
MNCPVCQSELRPVDRGGMEIDVCSRSRGVWLDRGELDKLIAAAGNYYAGRRGDDDSDYGETYHPPGNGHGYHPSPAYGPQPGYHPPKKKKGFLGNLFDFD